MQSLTDGIILYHGSYCEIKKPDILQGERYKDFGQGFYLTSSKVQAEGFIKTSLKKALIKGRADASQNYGYVSSFRFKQDEGLNIRSFPSSDVDWLHCVVAHRRKNTLEHIVEGMMKYDIIAGKIANDNTNATIAAYIAMAYGEIGSQSADEICIGLLLPERLQDQFCFRTAKATKQLSFIRSEQIWI